MRTRPRGEVPTDGVRLGSIRPGVFCAQGYIVLRVDYEGILFLVVLAPVNLGTFRRFRLWREALLGRAMFRAVVAFCFWTYVERLRRLHISGLLHGRGFIVCFVAVRFGRAFLTLLKDDLQASGYMV